MESEEWEPICKKLNNFENVKAVSVLKVKLGIK